MFDITIMTKTGAEVAQLHCVLNRCTIGKDRDNLIQLRGWAVAPSHAQVEQTTKGIFVHDTSNGAGTLVNGDKLTEKYGPLNPKDEILIGSYVIKLNAEKYVKQDQAKGKAKSQGEMNTQEIADYQTLVQEEINMWRKHIHQELLRGMDLKRTDVAEWTEDELKENVKSMISDIIDDIAEGLPGHLNRKDLARDVLNETIGLGPLEGLIADDSVTEIMVNSFDDIYVEREGRLEKSDIIYSDDDAVMSTIERIISPLGRRIDESSPMVDARLKDGSRVNAIIPPLSLKGPCVTIRKFSKKKLNGEDLVGFGSISQEMVDFLKMAVEQKQNIIISGGTGSGKTTLLNVLSNYIPRGERVVTIEDAAELKLQQPHLVSLEARPANLEGKGAVTIRDLVKNCLRMRPDRIVVGECRGAEALDMLQAMNTGHDGSLTTAHANTPRDMLSRLEIMVLMAGMDLPVSAIREQVSSAVDIVVQQTRYSDGSRIITHITEITGVESGVIQLQEIFRFKQNGIDSNGRVKGNFNATGLIPEFYEGLRDTGLEVDMSLFH